MVDSGPRHSNPSTCRRPSSRCNSVGRRGFSLNAPIVTSPPSSRRVARMASRRGAAALPSTVTFSVPVMSGACPCTAATTDATATVDFSQKVAGSLAWSGSPARPARIHATGATPRASIGPPRTVPLSSRTRIRCASASTTTVVARAAPVRRDGAMRARASDGLSVPGHSAALPGGLRPSPRPRPSCLRASRRA